jgi:C-terminal processing protease CtpA/Prc
MSRWIEYTPDNRVIEDHGIAPDILVSASANDFASGRDPVLEFALQRLGGTRGQAAPR